jgi:DNA-binding NarL/FixJ family response regulator
MAYQARPSRNLVGADRFDRVGRGTIATHCDVMIADDRALFREAMRTIMEAEDDMRVVADLQSAADVVGEANRSRPDVALLNAELPGTDPIVLARELIAEQPLCRVVFLVERHEVSFLVDALKAGAKGCVTNATPIRAFMESVRDVVRGQLLIPRPLLPELIDRLVHDSVVQDEAMRRIARLTDRERLVLALLADGGSNESIGRALYISPFTARTHIQNLITKLGVHSRLEAAMFVAQNDLRERLIEHGPGSRERSKRGRLHPRSAARSQDA